MSDTINPFINKLTASLDGVSMGEAISGLVSALMLLIIGTTASQEAQDGLLEQVVSTMRQRMQAARSIVETGQLPH